MNPGLMKEKAKFYRLERVPDGAAGHTSSLVLAFETKARMVPMRARMEQRADRQVIVQPYALTIRYYKDKLPETDMQIEYRKGKYLIEEVNEADEHFRYISMRVVRIKPQKGEN